MSDDVRATLGALAALRSALIRHAGDSGDVARAAGRAVDDARRTIAAEVAQRIAECNDAEAALRRCLSQKDAVCGDAEARLQRARVRLVAAQRAMNLADQAAATLLPAQRRYARETTNRVEEGLRFLGSAALDLERYLDRVSAGTIWGPPRSSAPPAGAAEPSMPAGITSVPLDLVDDGDGPVTGPESFSKGFSADDLRWSFDALHEVVLPALAQGLDREYLRDRDAREGRSGTRSYGACYDGFFGSTAIVLHARPDGRYGVVNGYHRIWVARQAGLSHVPARQTP